MRSIASKSFEIVSQLLKSLLRRICPKGGQEVVIFSSNEPRPMVPLGQWRLGSGVGYYTPASRILIFQPATYLAPDKVVPQYWTPHASVILVESASRFLSWRLSPA